MPQLYSDWADIQIISKINFVVKTSCHVGRTCVFLRKTLHQPFGSQAILVLVLVETLHCNVFFPYGSTLREISVWASKLKVVTLGINQQIDNRIILQYKRQHKKLHSVFVVAAACLSEVRIYLKLQAYCCNKSIIIPQGHCFHLYKYCRNVFYS